MVRSLKVVLPCALLVGALLSSPALAQTPADRAAFVTTLGADTLAVERFWRTPEGMEAHVVLRSPQTTVHRYRLDLDEAGQLRRYEAEVASPTPAGGAPLRREVVTPGEGGLTLAVTAEGETQTRTVEGDAASLPFIDMVHWPFELMLARAHAAAQDSVVQPLFTGRNALPFVLRRAGEGRMTVTHPFRGSMDVEVDAEGRLRTLSAHATTRALVVTRVPDFDTEAFARRSAALDDAGQTFGPLSGRGETVARVDGAIITVDFGQPVKRGREIFGGLVAWGELWRTGANRATHLSTDRPLVLGGLEVPAGEYTLFSIPQPEGGTLIVSRQTGQTGTAYDPSRDLGRVEMTRVDLPEPVELFTIEVADTAEGGELRIVWDRSAFVVPFIVRG